MRTVAAFGWGLGLGLLTLGMQKWLPGSFNQLGNSAAMWSLGAFLGGYFARGGGPWRAVAGWLLLVGAVVGYYAATTVLLHQELSAMSLRMPLFWAVTACVAGPVFGLAGAWARGGGRHWRGVVAIALLVGVFVAEGLYQEILFGHLGAMAILMAVGAIAAVGLIAAGETAGARRRTWRGESAGQPRRRGS